MERFFGPADVRAWALSAEREGPACRVSAEAHRALYSTKYLSSHGTLQRADDFLAKLRYTTYTYVLCTEDSVLRFSETSTSFFKDKMSKHAVHSAGAHSVRCAGEFHVRPRGGWDPHRPYSSRTAINAAEWELVLDSESGTYKPPISLVEKLALLLEANFDGLKVTTMGCGAEVLRESKKHCSWYGRG